MTTLIHKYAADFDPEVAVAKMKSGRHWPRREYVDPDADWKVVARMLRGVSFPLQEELVALLQSEDPDISMICQLFADARADIDGWSDIEKQFMLRDAEIFSLWDRKRTEAANSGTWMHAMLEYLFNGYQISPGDMKGELDAAVALVHQMGDVEVYRTEWCIYAASEDVAGSIDLVLKATNSDTFYLIDWKRSEKLQDKSTSYGRYMKPPLQDLEDCQGCHYRLQLNIYKWILQTYYGINIAAMKVLCVHPRYLPGGFVDDVPDLQAEVSRLMQSLRDERIAREMERETQPPSLPGPSGADGINTQPPAPELAATQPFHVELPSQRSVPDQLETWLEEIIDEENNAAPAAAKKRRLLPGAATHADQFKDLFQRSHNIIADTLDTYRKDVCSLPNSILHNTKQMLRHLREKFPNTSDEIRRLILVAAHLVEGKISEKPMLADSAALTWMVEGERHMRVHRGFLYIYDDDGCFLPFGGIPPEAVLHRVHHFFSCLEGIFRRMRPEVTRQTESVAAAIVSDLQSFQSEQDFLHACRDAANRRITRPVYPPRLDAPDEYNAPDARNSDGNDEETEESWTLVFAEKTWKLSGNVRLELMQTRLVSLLVEWCETEDQRSASVCYDDVCFVYDVPTSKSPIDVVKKGSGNNCYIKIPHPLLDPVLQVNTERLQKFYSQTFWCNLDVFRCCQAALAIAKRGLNVDRCFIGISPGGVGQSLYSLHLSEMYKHNHVYFDPNIWYLDEELRKQVETFARAFIMTGQEAPESSKKLHIDLYKKTISADGIMGRKPYGYSTKMFHTIGWTRLEVNRIMKFLGVGSNAFNSMFRRSLVWKAKARFIHKKFLAAYEDHEKDGIFEADPSLNKFLATSQASIAGLRLQWAFERDNNKDDCYQLIENYCNGGDAYLTEDVMRNACGLPVRQRQLQVEEGLANLLDADAESQAERDDKDVAWDSLRRHLLHQMLEKDMDVMSFYEFKKIPLKPDEHPNLSRSDLWDQMSTRKTVRPAIVRGKTGTAKPGVVMPFVNFQGSFTSLCPPLQGEEVRMIFEEEHDVSRVKEYAHACKARAINAENLKTYYESRLPAPKKGRRTLQEEELFSTNNSLIQKILDHEARLSAMIQPRRRLKQKQSVEESNHDDRGEQEANVGTESSGRITKQVEYSYSVKQKYSIRARRYGSVGGAQSMSRRLQVHAVGGYTVDLDIHNCCLTLVYQIVQKLSPDPALPEELGVVFDQVANNRAEFIASLGLQSAEGKEVINTVFNGGAAPKKLRDNETIKQLQRIALYVRWIACNLLHDDYMSLEDNKTKTFPAATIMSLMWHAIEDRILHVWSEHVLRGSPKHLSLHFDGLRVSRDAIQNMDEYIRACEDAISSKTPFNVKIVAKKHGNLIQLVQDEGTLVSKITTLPDLLKAQGNCIPCSVWHAIPTTKADVLAALRDEGRQENVEAKSTRYRTYRSVAAMAKIDLTSCVGLPPDHVRNFLLHYEGSGTPHCVSLRFDMTNKVATLIDGINVYKMSLEKFQDAVLAAIDRSTIISYWKRDTRDKVDDKTAVLLDMAAGASQHSDESDEGMGADEAQSSGHARVTQDEDENPVISDNILTTLCRETNTVLEDLGHKAPRADGRRRCPLCPFRSFTQLRLLRTHVQKHHTSKNQYVYSGTKQIKVILALYDNAASSQTDVADLLQTSATVMRTTIQPALCERISYIDKKIRLVLDAAGPRYVNLSAIGTTLQVRRARNLYYTQSFADLLIREMVMGHAQVLGTTAVLCTFVVRGSEYICENKTSHEHVRCRNTEVTTLVTRCHMAALEAGSQTSTLLPSRASHWMPVLEDIASSTAFKLKMERMQGALFRGDEWHYISMDATLKLCMKVMGQAPYRASKKVRDEAPFGDDVAWRRLLTIRGRTGAVLMMHPLQSESSEQIVEAMQHTFTEEQLQSVRYVATDSPSEKLLTQLQNICPNLQALMLDPIHLAIVYEYGFWNKKSSGSKQLRRILRKCIAVDASLDKNYWQLLYDGKMARPLGDAENKFRAMILDLSMSDREATQVLNQLDQDTPFLNRVEFIKSVAALCRIYKSEVTRKAAGPNKDINKILWAACAPDRLEWLMNNLRIRHTMTTPYRWFLPSGTSSNEALHAEINSWTRSINALHRSTLALKLQYFMYIKTLQHFLSKEFPMSHVVSASMILGRALHESIWSNQDWSVWCAEQQTEGGQSKATLPLTKSRRSEADVVKCWVMKRPSARAVKTKDRGRRVTPLSVKRIHTLRTAGVKRSGSWMTREAMK